MLTVSYDESVFAGLDQKITRSALKKFWTSHTSGGGTNNILLNHLEAGQSNWTANSIKYDNYKRKKGLSPKKFVATGDALKAIIAKGGKEKVIRAVYRKKHQMYVVHTTIRKMVDGKNVYKFAQMGKFKSMSYETEKGERKTVSKKEFLNDLFYTGIKYHDSYEKQTNKMSKQQFKNAAMKQKYKWKSGTIKKNARSVKMVTVNLPGDDRLINMGAFQDSVLDAILESRKRAKKKAIKVSGGK